MKTSRCFFLLCVILPCVLTGQNLYEERIYEPIVIPGYNMTTLENIPVDEMYVYSYNEDDQTWRMIPFQIDEKIYGPDSLNPERGRWYYFPPAWWADVDTIEQKTFDGLYNDHDELVFMIRDMGDKAPEKPWIENDEARNNPRVEIIAYDPDDEAKKGYVYVYRSKTLKKTGQDVYQMKFDAQLDWVETKYYAIGLGEFGLIQDIVIKEPGGNGQDIFDTQKFRFSGVIDAAFPVPLVLTERSLYRFPQKYATENPSVRIVRKVRQTLKIVDLVLEEASFPVTAKFYPFSGTIVGGTSLSPEDLVDYFGTDIMIILKDLRQSWDFNSSASGMKFYNAYNDGVVIDGKPDELDKTIDIPISEWSLISGDPGSMFVLVNFQETKWKGTELYFWDSQTGSPADSSIFTVDDTGDNMSYGDFGILFRNHDQDDITLDLNFIAYFMPETDLTKEDGEKLAVQAKNPVKYYSTVLTGVDGSKTSAEPQVFALYQNYPNPFNRSTQISFVLPGSRHIDLRLYDTQGRLVRVLADGFYTSGKHSIKWDGLDEDNQPVATGFYLYRLKTEDFTQTKKLLLIQ